MTGEDRSAFLVTGPSAAGKTTVAHLLAASFPKGVHVDGDVFRRSIVTGRHEMTPAASAAALEQLRLRYRIATSVAGAYCDAGFTVVLDDLVAGPMLEEVVGQLRCRPLDVVVLLPSEDVLRARNAGRGIEGYERWSVGELRSLFADLTPRLGLWLDTSHDTPEQTVGRILRDRARARVHAR